MKPKFLPAGLLLMLYSVLMLVSCSKSSTNSDYNTGGNNNGGNNQNSNTVTMSNMQFNPTTLTVKSGTTVTWVNDDDMNHTATADGGAFNSGSLKKGDKFTYTFSTAGTYAYHCTFHANMKASVVVN